MKANELMIGDWVNLSKGNWSENRQVELIDIEMVAEGVYLAEPIPLTPEILEKNGFLNDGVSFWYLDFRIVLSTSKGVSLVCGRQKRFKYVHELQHALRLANIEKEITL